MALPTSPDPISMGFASVSLAATLYGAYEKYEGAKAQESIQEQEVGVEKQQNALRQQSAILQQQRMEKENLRYVQRARSLALAGAVGGGAQFGSGLQGGFGQIAGSGNTNELGLSQSGQLRDQMFGLDTQLSNLKIAYAQAGGQINLGSGIMGLGQTIGQNNQQLTDLTKQGIGGIQSLFNG